MRVEKRKAVMAASMFIAVMAIALSACNGTGKDGPSDGNNAGTLPGSAGVEIPDWNLDQGPVSSTTQARLEPSEIRGKLTEYLAVTLWVETSMRIAMEQPQEFEKVMFSGINEECVRKQQERMDALDEIPVEDLMECNQSDILASHDRWEDATAEERAARSTRGGGSAFLGNRPTFVGVSDDRAEQGAGCKRENQRGIRQVRRPVQHLRGVPRTPR